MSNTKDQIKKDVHSAEKKTENAAHEVADKAKDAAGKIKDKAKEVGKEIKKKVDQNQYKSGYSFPDQNQTAS